MNEPTLHPAGAAHRGVLAWQWESDVAVLSSASVGGGFTTPDWLLNIGVAADFARTDLEKYAAEVAADLGLTGTGVALLTAADVGRFRRSTCEGVTVHATVGVSKPTWAADPSGGYTAWAPGTINLVVELPVRLEHAAAVNAVVTMTEAKSQALQEHGVPGTGTASDAVVIVWPTSAPTERFAGPRSEWGTRIAQAAHAAVSAGVGTAR